MSQQSSLTQSAHSVRQVLTAYIRMAILQFIAAVPLSIAHAEDCRNAMTQSELNDCAYEAYRKSDAELNALYKQITSRLKDDPKQAQLLVTAQRAWIAFRDAECAFVTSPSTGGSVYPMVLSNCRERLTRARLNDLRSYLHCREGDSDCPLPPQ
jgi:uncharacterized protein YecT (DUF1311 family)